MAPRDPWHGQLYAGMRERLVAGQAINALHQTVVSAINTDVPGDYKQRDHTSCIRWARMANRIRCDLDTMIAPRL